MKEEQLDYTALMPVLAKADADFTAEFGCGTPYQEWDAALEFAIIEYNKENGTSLDPVEVRIQYIEQVEAILDSEIEVAVDDLILSKYQSKITH